MPETLNPIPLCRCCHKNGVFKCLFSDFIYENEIENYSQMLYDTFGILFETSEHDKIYTICDECIGKLRISSEFKNGILACEKKIKQEPLITDNTTVKSEEIANYEDHDTEVPLIADITTVKREETADYEDHDIDVKVEESGNKSDKNFSESEIPLIADITVKREETADYEDHDAEVPLIADNTTFKREETADYEDHDTEVSLRNTSDIQENKCNICNKTYRFKWTLENHVRTHDGYKCQICPEILSNQREHTKHIESKHSVDGKYCCIACDATFSEVKKLNDHVKTHIRHRCEVCNKDYKRKCDLRKHQRVHSDEKMFKCPICDSLFMQQQLLKVHMETHAGGTSFEWEECGRKFTAKGDSVEVKKYGCQYCDKRVMTKWDSIVHERTHTGLKPYVCEKCDKTFSSKKALLNHDTVHLARKPYVCSVCHKAYKRKGTLKIHMFTHTGIKSFRCGVCSRTFLHKDYLTRHMKVHNGERPYKCDICKKTYRSKRYIRDHMLAVHLGFKPTPAECDICKKIFKYRNHLREHMLFVHLGFRPPRTECDICKKTFKYKRSLRKHMSALHLDFKPKHTKSKDI